MDKKLILLYFLLATFTVLLSFDYADRLIIGVSDDITHVKILEDYQKGITSTFDVFHHYLTEPARYQRPVSGVYAAVQTVLGKPNIFMFFFLRFLYTFTFFAYFRMLLKREIKDEYFIFALLFLSGIVPIAGAVYFQFCMWHIFLMLSVYCLHLDLLYRKKPVWHFLSGLMFVLASMFTEYALFMVPFVAYLIFFQIPSSNSIRKFFLAVVLPLIFIVIYRYILVDWMFGNPEKFDEARFAFTIENFIRYLATTVKLFIFYIPNLLWKSLLAVRFYTFTDGVLFMIASAVTIILLQSKFLEKNYRITLKHVALTFLLFLVSFSFCAVTFYKPYVGGFNTRIFSLSIFVFPVSVGVITFFIRNIALRKIIFSVVLLISTITLLSQKNAWVFASELNEKFISSEKLANVDLSKSNTVLISYEQEKYPQFVVEEPANSHLIPYYHIYHQNRKPIDLYDISLKPKSGKFWGIEYDRNTENFYYINGQKIKIFNREFNYPFYIYQYETDKLDLIGNQQHLRDYYKHYVEEQKK